MHKMEEELKQRLKFSEQKRTHLKTLLAQHVSEENNFVWSIVDLMTLLLIFFIFLYSQNTGPVFSNPMTNIRPPMETPEFQHQKFSSKIIPMKQEISGDSRKILNALTMDFPKTLKPDTTNSTMASATPVEEVITEVAPNESIAQLKKEALAAIEENDQKNFSIRWNERRLIFVLGERVTFPRGQAKLLSESQPILKRISHLIASKKDFTVLVSGHTDDTPIDTYQFPSNWELSAARAISVARFLSENGVDPHRLSIQGYAEFRPIHSNSTPENKQANRRVEITLIKQKPQESEHSYIPGA
jgi:chemotaxis protein MotB